MLCGLPINSSLEKPLTRTKLSSAKVMRPDMSVVDTSISFSLIRYSWSLLLMGITLLIVVDKRSVTIELFEQCHVTAGHQFLDVN